MAKAVMTKAAAAKSAAREVQIKPYGAQWMVSTYSSVSNSWTNSPPVDYVSARWLAKMFKIRRVVELTGGR